MYSCNKNDQKRKNSQRKKILLVTVIAVVAILCVFMVLEISNITNLINSGNSGSRSTGQQTKGESPKAHNSDTRNSDTIDDNHSNNGSQQQDSKKSPTGSSSQKLVAPSGSFVSAHVLSSNKDKITSVCVTTPGAKCEITFIKDGEVISLPEQLTDAEGAAYWEGWSPAQYKITKGSWKIQAKAILGNQTLVSKDELNLVVP